MMSGSRQYTTAAAALLVTLSVTLLAGCTPAAPAPPVRTPAPATPSPDPAAGAAVQQLRGVLLVPADAGPAWTAAGAPAVDAAAPCGGTPVASRFPQAVRVGTAMEHVDLEVREAVAVYRDAGTAAAAFDAAAEGLACDSGTMDGAPVRISPAQDLGRHVDADRATGWQVELAGRDVLVVAVQAGAAVLTFHYAAPSGTGIADRPDALALTRTGVDRLVAA